MRTAPSRTHNMMDRVGMLLSAVCMAHCALLPVIVVLGVASHANVGITDKFVHIGVGAIVIPVSILAFWGGWVRHGRNDVVAVGFAGVVFVVLGMTVAHEQFGLVGDALVTSIGSMMLIYAHWQNRACACSDHS